MLVLKITLSLTILQMRGKVIFTMSGLEQISQSCFLDFSFVLFIS